MNTKKTILVMFACVLLGTFAQAQLKFGVKAGVPFAVSNISKGSIDIDNSRPFNAGITGEFMIPLLNMGVTASALFEMQKSDLQNYDLSSASSVPSEKKSVNLYYVVFPINFKWNFLPLQIVDAYLVAGPRFELQFGNNMDNNISKFYDTKNFNYGADLGLGVQFLKKVQAEVTYFYDFENTFSSLDSKPSGFFFSVAYMF
jgi:hypothetical protein